MISREALIQKLSVGMKFQCMFDLFKPVEPSVLTVSEIDPVIFVVNFTKEDGAKIIMPLGSSYKYDIDEKYFQVYHNDRTNGWQVVEKYKIIPAEAS